MNNSHYPVDKKETLEIKDKKESRNAWIIAALGLVYAISPIDFIPDIPVVGWIDDFFVLSAALLNLWEKSTGRTEYSLRKILKTLKWVVVILGIIVILLMILIGALIIKWLSEYY